MINHKNSHPSESLQLIKYIAKNVISFCLLALTIIIVKLLIKIYSFIYNLKKRGFEVIEPSLSKLASHIWSKDTFKLLNELLNYLERSKNGIVGWISPVGRPFLLVSNDLILRQVLIQHQDKLLNTHYKLEILEYLRKTKISIGPSWKTLHTTISKFSIYNQDLLSQLNKLLVESSKKLVVQEPLQDFSVYVNKLYWQIASLVCFGLFDDILCSLLDKTWISLQDVLNHPFSHIYENIFPHLPFGCVRKFKNDTSKLRKYLLKIMKTNKFPEFSYISSLGHLSIPDKLEVVIEFLMALSRSTAPIVVGLVWHLSNDQNLANSIRKEVESVIIEDQGDGNSENNSNISSISLHKLNALSRLSGELLSSMKLLDAAYKETLRLYSPIQICRYTNQELPLLINGDRIFIPKGTNILCNNWFIHRSSIYWKDPNTFDHKRFMSKDASHNYFHPFSIGLRVCPGLDISGCIIKLVVASILLHIKNVEPSSDKLSPKFTPQFAMPVSLSDVYINFNNDS